MKIQLEQEIEEKRKLLELEQEKKREAGMDVADAPTSGTNGDSANVAQDVDWAFIVHCSYNPLLQDTCMSVVDSYIGTLIVVPQSISLQSVICSFLLIPPLQGFMLHAQITPLIL